MVLCWGVVGLVLFLLTGVIVELLLRLLRLTVLLVGLVAWWACSGLHLCAEIPCFF